jgi:O-antigen ligase
MIPTLAGACEAETPAIQIRRRGVPIVTVTAVSIAFIACFWGWFILSDEGSIGIIFGLTPKFHALKTAPAHITFFFLMVSLGVVAGLSFALSRKKYVFFVLMVFSFMFAEVPIAGINEAAFIIRYTAIVILISLGLVEFTRRVREGLDAIQVIALLHLFWCIVTIFINGLDIQALAMLPMQAALVLGLLFGLRSVFDDFRDIESLNTILAWFGIIMTIFHLSSFVFARQPFLAGRFRSYMLLPTNFANAYVFAYSSLIWLTFRQKALVWKPALCLLLAAGAVLIFLSGTRNSLLMLVIVLVVLSFVWRVGVPFSVGAIGVTLAPLAAILFEGSRFVAYLGERLTWFSAEDRLRVWQVTWDCVVGRPVLGYGLGKENEVLGTSLHRWEVLNAHNAFLGIWLQIGLVGLAFILAIYFLAMIRGFTLLLSKAGKGSREVLVLPVALLIGLFFTSFSEELFLTSRGGLHQFIWGLEIFSICSYSTYTRREKSSRL